MTTHPEYETAVLFLAELHATLPQIIHNAIHESAGMETAHGWQIKRELATTLNLLDAVTGRKCRECGRSK